MDFVLIGLPYDRTQTCRKGAAKAPDMIRNILPKLETFVNGIDLAEHFISDAGNIEAGNLKKYTGKKFPIVIGGEHTITRYGAHAVNPDKIVVFDAHPDCEDTDGHTGVVRRLIEHGFEVVLFGTRIMSKTEHDYIKKHGIKIAKLNDLKRLKGRIYLSVDFDILDVPVLPAVGNPEPDGLSFKEVSDAIKVLAPKLCAVDFVEYTPTQCDNDIHLLTAGKLIYSAMAEVVKNKK